MKRFLNHYEVGFALRLVIAMAVVLLGLEVATALASNGNGGMPPGGNNPCPPSYHAEGDQCVHNGDGGGNCGQNQSDNGGDHGYGHEGQCGDETDTTPTDTTPTDTTPTETTPTETTPTEPTPTEPTPTTPEPPVESTTEVTTSTPIPTTTEPTPTPTLPTAQPKPKSKAAKPKPDRPHSTKIVHVQPKPNGVVVVTTADGRKHTAIMGSG